MKQSNLFTKTIKDISAEEVSVNAQLLLKAGFVDKLTAGIFSYLPLGLRVLQKVEQIVREEMNSLGAQEIFMPSLQPKENWDTTGRYDSVDVLFKLKSQTDKEYVLGASHEEIVTPLVQKFIRSYKNLPVAVYQINTKFRDELRAKSGVLRGREFRMKDMYSFHSSQADLAEFYEKSLEAYRRVFKRCGLDVKVVEASGGIFTSNPSHEFQALTSAGEDVILACDKCDFGQNLEVATLKDGDKCPKCDGVLTKVKGIEVGNTFDLGTKYSDSFGVEFADETGKNNKVLMGCYGIGTTRLLGSIVEIYNDSKGIIWPESVAPYHVHLVVLGKSDEVKDKTEEVYMSLQKAGIEVLFDDREESAGVKLNDSDLIGLPVRVIISEKTLAIGKAEVKRRNAAEADMVDLDGLLSFITQKS